MVISPKHDFNGGHYKNPDDQQALRNLARLYELIIQFRKDAAKSSNPELRIQFDMAAEIIAGLARSFRLVENQEPECETEQDTGADTDSDSSAARSKH